MRIRGPKKREDWQERGGRKEKVHGAGVEWAVAKKRKKTTNNCPRSMKAGNHNEEGEKIRKEAISKKVAAFNGGNQDSAA